MTDMLGEDWVNDLLSDRNMSIAEEVREIARDSF